MIQISVDCSVNKWTGLIVIAIFGLTGGTIQFIIFLLSSNYYYYSPIDFSSIITLCVFFSGLEYQNILYSLPLPYDTLYWSFLLMDILWIIFAGLMLYGISKKKPGLMVPFIGFVGFMNVVRTLITKSFYYINYRLSIIVSEASHIILLTKR